MQVRKALAAFRPALPTSVFTALAGRRRYGGNAIAIALLFSVAAFTTQNSYAENATIEEVVVTGSLLKRDSFDSASPLKVIDDVELKAEATPALGEVKYWQY